MTHVLNLFLKIQSVFFVLTCFCMGFIFVPMIFLVDIFND